VRDAGVVGIENLLLLCGGRAHGPGAEPRGPDSEGIECWPASHLASAARDLRSQRCRATADDVHRPILGVVFNGAIYNFRALTTELTAGRPFPQPDRHRSLLHGLPRWGIDGLGVRLRGMFALRCGTTRLFASRFWF